MANLFRNSDVDGHIKRNRERIEDGILPQIFEMRLKLYEARKKERDDFLASEPADLQPMALVRIHTLRTMLEIMDRDGDADEQRPNVEAILKAYRKKKLTWSDEGKVTYWSKGKQVSEPREYSIEDLKEFNVKYNKGGKGFWVEGVRLTT